MARTRSWSLVGLLVLLPGTVFAGHSLDEYPLRVHIFTQNAHSHYIRQVLESVDGEGRANLYENGEARGFDFGYRCNERLRTSAEYETYPARWKKQGEKLEMLMPKLGKSGTMQSCELKVNLKDFAFYFHNGMIATETIEAYKAWMVKHQYDPEHGKNLPVMTTAPEQPPATQTQQ